MLRNGSPTGANVYDTEWNGRPARIVDRDHHRHLPATEGDAWDTYPEKGDGWLVLEYAPTVTPAAPVAAAPAAEVEPEPAAPAPAPRVEAVTTPRPSGRTPRKFEFREALRGRIGDGDDQITRPEFVALAMLETYASADLTSARPGHARLAEDLGYAGTDPQRVVRRLLASLTRKGYLVITHHGTNIVGNVATEYRLTLPEWG